jgi:Zn-dependent protease with chaperone function
VQTSVRAASQPIDFAALQEFPNLTGAAFQHPFDLQASEALKKVPVLSGAIRKFSSSVAERQIGLMLTSNCIRLGRQQGRSLYEKFERAAAILDLPKLPEVYVSSALKFNAEAYGIDVYRIILYAPLVDALTEEELLALIGHELGHLKCNHQLYMTMVYLLRTFGVSLINSILPLGLGVGLSAGLQLAILHWYRMAELSCDRAALLVVQDEEVVARMLAKLAGGSRRVLPEINLAGIMQQVSKYDDNDSRVDKLLKISLMLNETHPFPVVRVKEVMEWANSKQFKGLLSGTLAGGPAEAARDVPGVLCESCKAAISIAAVFCPLCSARQRDTTRVCAACGRGAESSETTCEGCGNNLVTIIE